MIKPASFFLTTAAVCLLAACSSTSPTPPDTALTVQNEHSETVQEASAARPVAFGPYADRRGCTVTDKDSGQTEGLVNRLAFEHFNGIHYMQKDDVLQHLEEAKQRGCSLERRDAAGFAPLHTAILLQDNVMIEFLLKNGASPYTEIKGDPATQSGSQFYGKNSFQLLEDLKGFELRDNKMKTIKSRNNRQLRVPKSQGVRTDYSRTEALLIQYRRQEK
ncbi:MAG: ankyrin repeat domain-containing protein [Neisseria sp.]|nr:ankyrin repeat domain-containing protein [Neisseria sp.]